MKTKMLLACAAAMILGGAILGATQAYSKTVQSNFGQITYFDQYSGDTLVFLENNPAGCEQGFWMRPTHAGFKDNLALVEKAIHAKARVKVSANDRQRWPQTTDKRCRVQSIAVEPVSQAAEEAITPIATE